MTSVHSLVFDIFEFVETQTGEEERTQSSSANAWSCFRYDNARICKAMGHCGTLPCIDSVDFEPSSCCCLDSSSYDTCIYTWSITVDRNVAKHSDRRIVLKLKPFLGMDWNCALERPRLRPQSPRMRLFLVGCEVRSLSAVSDRALASPCGRYRGCSRHDYGLNWAVMLFWIRSS